MPIVTSSAIRQIDYRPEQRELLVRFASGELYAYACVPQTVYREFVVADSKGHYFACRIRDRYPHRRLGLGRRPTQSRAA